MTKITVENNLEVTDKLGRVITLKQPAPLDNLDFSKASGQGTNGEINTIYLVEVAHLKYIAAIDGETVITPGNEAELRALYSKLGNEGNTAARQAVADNFFNKEDDDLKNS